MRGELQQRINAAALATRLTTARAPHRDAVVSRAQALWEGELQAMSDDITRHPEIGFKETRSVGLLTDWLERHGFSVDAFRPACAIWIPATEPCV